MLSERRAAVWWGLALTIALHLALGLLVSMAVSSRHRISSAPGPAMQVQLVAAPVAPPVPDSMPDLAPAAPELTEPPPPPELPPSAAPERDEVVYYVQDELDHKVVVLKDETGEAELDAPPGVVMHLFIDAGGSVTSIHFEGNQLTPAQREKLRAAFMQVKFMPGIKDGRAVASRIKIALTGPDGLD